MSGPLVDAVKPLFGGQKPTLTQENIQKLPYASISAKLGSGPEQVMMLSKIVGDHFYYFGMDRSFLVFKQGRLVRSHSFPANIWYTGIESSDVFAQGLHQIKHPVTEKTLVDFNRDGIQNLCVTATFTRDGAEDLTLHGKTYGLTRIRQQVSIPQMNWSYTNFYWIFPENGKIMRSLVYLHPALAPLDLVVLKFATP